MKQPWFWGDKVTKEAIPSLLAYVSSSSSLQQRSGVSSSLVVLVPFSFPSFFFLSFSISILSLTPFRKQPVGTYLVRCSATPGNFVLQFIGKHGKETVIESILLQPSQDGLSLSDLVTTVVKRYKLKKWLPGRKLTLYSYVINPAGSKYEAMNNVGREKKEKHKKGKKEKR
jgi:hypothetical protein